MDTFKSKVNTKISNVSKTEREHRQNLLGECSQKIDKLQKETESTVERLEKSVQEVKKNYNWQIEDLNTKIENRVDLQFLETTIEGLNQSVMTRDVPTVKAERNCVFSGKVKEIFV